MASTEVEVKLTVSGAQSMMDALERAADDLEPYRGRLIAMGWTETMAREFLADIAGVITKRVIEVRPDDDSRHPRPTA